MLERDKNSRKLETLRNFLKKFLSMSAEALREGGSPHLARNDEKIQIPTLGSESGEHSTFKIQKKILLVKTSSFLFHLAFLQEK